MRVLIAASIYPPDPGGPALHAQRHYEWFRERDIDTEVVAFRNYLHFPKLLRHIIYLMVLLRRIRKYDVVYAHDALGTGLPALLAAKIGRKKFIVRIGGDVVWERESGSGKTELSLRDWYRGNSYKDNRKYKLSKFVVSRADKVVVPSLLLKNLYNEFYGADNVVVIENPLPLKKEVIPFEFPRMLVYASRLVAYKNLLMVIRVMSRVLPDYPDAKFYIMGDGPERQKLEREIRSRNIGEQVILTGNISQEEVKEKIHKAYLGIAPAFTEFNPNYILECIAYSKPVLVSKENGLPLELPKEFLFDPHDENDFETQLRFLLTIEGYRLAEDHARKIDYSRTWEATLEENFEAIKSVF